MKEKVERHALFIRVPMPLYKEMLEEALKASAELGRTVTVQTIALQRMERNSTSNSEGTGRNG